MSVMRAKMQVFSVEDMKDAGGEKVGESLKLHGVAKDGPYDASGLDEDNTFAKFTPHAELEMSIMNQALFGQFWAGQRFYVDFTGSE